MRRSGGLAAVVVLVMMVGQGLAEEGRDLKGKEGVGQVGAFAMELLPRLEGENVVTSPYLISSAFALLRTGARGQTQGQMDAVFHFPRGYEFPLLAEEKKAGGVTVSMSSMLFVDKQVKLEGDFLAAAEKRFRTTVTAVDLKDQKGAAAAINKAVAAATHDKITDAVSAEKLRETGTYAFVLANTLYFKGTWKTKFEKKETKEAVFHVPGPLARTVPMMSLKGGYLMYGHFEGVQVLKVPYAGEKYSLMILLPDDVKGFAGLGKRPDVGHVQAMLGKMQKELVDLYMPRFSVVDKHELKGALVAMGMRDAFRMKADFSGMKSSGLPLFLGFATEQAIFAVDEEGTEAAAAVTVGGSLFGEGGHREPPKPIVFRVDHPCVMVLVENGTGMPLFVAGLSSPAAWAGK